MNTPPLLLLAALLFWGWQTGHLWLGLATGVALESSRLVSWRWSLSRGDFIRLWNICTVLFLGLAVLLLINEGTVSFNDFFADAGRRPEAMRQAGRSALVWFQWFPMIFLPFMLAVAFNESPHVDATAFSWWLRREQKRDGAAANETVRVAYLYFAICLLAAGAGGQVRAWFYPGLAVLLGWALWSLARERRRSWRWNVAWCLLFAAFAMGGHFAHHGLVRLQQRLEEMNAAWFSHMAALGFDPREARTSMGRIGRIKMSDQIILRLKTDGGVPPTLLRENAYDQFRGVVWTTSNREFNGVPAESDDSTWKFLPDKASRRVVTIGAQFRRGKGLLPLPAGASEVGDLSVGNVSTNWFGAARLENGPGLVIYNARYDDGVTFDGVPRPDDFKSSDETEPAIAQVAADLKLAEVKTPDEALQRIGKYFADNFQYAVFRGKEHVATSNETALARFLLHTRSGHCEYFATATTLLLRKAGVPARYAVGYSVQEGSGTKYIVRARHAHAWALYWDGKVWRDFDTTPGSWVNAEAARSSWFQPLKDLWSNVKYEFAKFRWGKAAWRQWLMLTPLPLLIVVVWKFFRGKGWKALRARQQARVTARLLPGADSEFYLIEKHFSARGLPRLTGETWSDWWQRIVQQEQAAASLTRVLALHQRLRFDPGGLGIEERMELRDAVQQWLAAQRARGNAFYGPSPNRMATLCSSTRKSSRTGGCSQSSA